MKETRNYYPSIVIDGQEWMDMNPSDCGTAYSEASRMKREYGAQSASVKVFTQGALVIRNWKEGRCNRVKGSFLYSISV